MIKESVIKAFQVQTNETLGDMNTLNSWEVLKNAIKKAEEKGLKNKPLWMQPNEMRVMKKKKRSYQTTREYDEYLAYKRV